MKTKRCTNSSCRREFKLSTTVCPHCGKKYPRGGFDPGLRVDPGLRGQYAVVLTHVGTVFTSKLSTIKVIRFRTGLGLRDAKTIIDNTPSLVATGITASQAITLRDEIQAEGSSAIVVSASRGRKGVFVLPKKAS